MQDLNSTLFYKTKFNISAMNTDDDLLWKIVLHIREWQVGKWNKEYPVVPTQIRKWTALKFGKKLFWNENPDNTRVFIESAHYIDESTNHEYWACDIMEQATPPTGMCAREWHTEIGFEKTSNNTAVFSCVLSYGDVPGFIGPVQDTPGPSIPRLITNILRDSSLKTDIGIDSIPIRERKLLVGNWPDFKDRLINPEREIPYIYITAESFDIESGTPVFPVDPKDVAYNLCGNAIVYYSGDIGIVEENQYMETGGYHCHNGTIYIFYPANPTRTGDDGDDLYKIRYITTEQVTEYGEKETIHMLRRALAQDVNFYDTFFRLDILSLLRILQTTL